MVMMTITMVSLIRCMSVEGNTRGMCESATDA